MPRSIAGAVSVVLIAALAAGCSSGDTTASSGDSPASAAGSSDAVASPSDATSSGSDQASPSADDSSAGSAVGGLPEDHSVCALITVNDAAAIIGEAGKAVYVPDTSDKNVTHIDRCAVMGGSAGMSYQVDRYSTSLPTMMVQRTKVMASKGTTFDVPGGADGVGFLITTGSKTVGRVFIALPGDLAIDLSSTGATPAQAEQIAQAVAQRLFDVANG